MGRACSTHLEKRNVYTIQVGETEENESLGRPRRRWQDNNKLDLRETGCGGIDWIDLAQDRDQ
jgi:hypothetical protein